MSRKKRMIARRLMAALVFAAAVAPAAALARPGLNLAPSAAPTQVVAPPSAPDVQPIPSGSGAGFRWSDAAIGAGGAALLLGAGAATWAVVQRRRRHATVPG
jgi:hypothetical protein